MITLLISLLTIQPIKSIQSIPTPAGFTRVQAVGFGEYLRGIKLKADKTVYLYNGEKKVNQTAQYAVLDISIGIEDYQHSADAVISLRAEYLCKTNQRIVFYDKNNEAHEWKPPYYDRAYLSKYLEGIYKTCNTASLEKQMKPKNIMDIKIGDVLIKGGFPGHVVIVVDVAINKKGEKAIMLAQSYMPSQDIHILKGQDGPWYFAREGVIETPEYTFHSSQVRTW